MKIARPPRHFEPEEQEDWNEEVERMINKAFSTTSSWGSITNVTTDRVYDANSTTIDELADVLGTLIAELRTKGILT